MASLEQKFYTEDTCTLKTNRRKIGQIDRTYSDVSTHRPDPLHEYPGGIERGAGISSRDYHRFLASGIPPQGTVVVTWFHLPWQQNLESILIREALLRLVERALLRGDIVKQNPRDAMSGTVIRVDTSVTLAPPAPWVRATASPLTRLARHNEYGNFATDETDLIRNIAADDLAYPNIDADDFVIYNDWIGKVIDTENEVSIRLSNGSIVVAESEEELTHTSPDAVCEVGDYVTTSKGNLRRGRWVFGSYDANIKPAGFVAGVRVTGLLVNWLYQCGNSNQPPESLDSDVLDGDRFHIYNRRRLPSSGNRDVEGGTDAKRRRLDLDLYISDRVRFSDLTAASLKYSPSTPAGKKLKQIPRTDTLGYDINVFLVVETTSEVVVQWQDLTISRLNSTELVPFLDLDGEDEVWPGELVTTRQITQTNDDSITPVNVGVVQSVDANDRMAEVRWFNKQIKLSQDSLDHIEGELGEPQERADSVSLYDIWTVPALARRVGDYVVIWPVPELSHDDPIALLHNHMLGNFGEVIELGLDGCLTVRLAAAYECRDVKVHWDKTVLVFSTDSEELEDVLAEDEEEDSEFDDFEEFDLAAMPGSWPITFQFTEDGQIIDGSPDDEEWETEDEMADDSIAEEDDPQNERTESDAARGDASLEPDQMNTSDEGAMDAVPEPPVQQPTASSNGIFSYATMFPPNHSRPASFAILDGAAPQDHHYSDAVSGNMTTQRIRRINKEHRILATSLPEGQVFVRTWESNLDLLRILILGPLDTPYEYAPFVIDMHLDTNFPSGPPKTFFHSWTHHKGPVNPNLYEDGTICLSLLGTWPSGEHGESWSMSHSTVLQIVVSLLGLVLVKEPFYNEAGYEVRAGTVESAIPSRLYSERTYLRSRGFISHALGNPVSGIDDVIKEIYLGGPQLLGKALQSAVGVVRKSRRPTELTANGDAANDHAMNGDSGVPHSGSGGATEAMTESSITVSAGALAPLKRELEKLLFIFYKHDKVAGNGALTREFARDVGVSNETIEKAWANLSLS